MSPESLLDSLLAAGLSLRIDGERLIVNPAAKLTDEMRAMIASQKGDLMALLASSFCPVGHKLDPKDICWKCCYRRCSGCGRDTGSCFIELCNPCGNRDEWGVRKG